MGKEDNQRLEFLGDAVLQYIMSDLLYQSHPADQEGSLTHLRALLVCEAALSQVARGLGIGQALRMDRGEELTGGRHQPQHSHGGKLLPAHLLCLARRLQKLGREPKRKAGADGL